MRNINNIANKNIWKAGNMAEGYNYVNVGFEFIGNDDKYPLRQR